MSQTPQFYNVKPLDLPPNPDPGCSRRKLESWAASMDRRTLERKLVHAAELLERWSCAFDGISPACDRSLAEDHLRWTGQHWILVDDQWEEGCNRSMYEPDEIQDEINPPEQARYQVRNGGDYAVVVDMHQFPSSSGLPIMERPGIVWRRPYRWEDPFGPASVLEEAEKAASCLNKGGSLPAVPPPDPLMVKRPGDGVGIVIGIGAILLGIVAVAMALQGKL